MSRTRRTFEKDCQSCFGSLKRKDTIEVLAKKYELLPNQISMEVRSDTEFLRFFLQKKKYQAKDEIPTEKLYAQWSVDS
jgi:hypothetical protein